MTVATMLKSKQLELVTVTADSTIASLAQRLSAAHIGAAPVVDEEWHLVGIISERDVVRGLVKYGAELGNVRVAELMTPHVYRCTSTTSITEAMQLMTVHRVRHLPVVDDSRLVGIVSIGDVVKNRLQDKEMEANVLRDALIAAH